MILAWPLAAWLSVVSGAHLTALWRSARERVGAGPAFAPEALLLRPLAGDEPELTSRLAVTGGVTRVRLCVGDRTDPAHPAALATGLDVVVTGATGPNHKVDQLARALEHEHEPWDVAVLCDSDVELGSIDLGSALARFADPSLGLAWFAPVPEATARSFGDRLTQSVLAGSLHSFPLLTHIDPNGVVGKLLLVRNETLRAVGGLGPLRHHLGEDVELGRRVRALPARVERLGTVTTAGRGISAGEAVARFARWVAVVRTQRPLLLASYPLLFGATTPALVCAACVGGWMLFPAAFLLATRLLVWSAAQRAAGHPRRLARLLPDLLLADAVLWAALVRSFWALHWRGRPLTFGARRLREHAQEPLGEGVQPRA